MITIFGPESFYPFGALKKFASYFRQHPMVTIWQTHFFHQIFHNSLTKHIFFNFQKHNQYAKPLAKPFDSSQTLVLIASRGKKHAFKKCHETNSEVVFRQSWPTTQKIFKSARLHVAQKWLFTFSHSGKKWTLLFLSFSRFLHYMTSGYAFLRMWSWNHAYGVFHVPATQLYALYAASDHFSVNFRYVRISHLSASFQGVMFKKQIC